MRRTIIAASTAALLALSGSAAFAAGPPPDKGGPAQDQCEELKGEKNQNPNGKESDEEDKCDY